MRKKERSVREGRREGRRESQSEKMEEKISRKERRRCKIGSTGRDEMRRKWES